MHAVLCCAVLQISWDWASCDDLIEGNIMMLQKPGGSAYYQAFNFANSRQARAVAAALREGVCVGFV